MDSARALLIAAPVAQIGTPAVGDPGDDDYSQHQKIMHLRFCIRRLIPASEDYAPATAMEGIL